MIFTEVFAPLIASLLTVPLMFKAVQDPSGWFTRVLWFLAGMLGNVALMAFMTGFNVMLSVGIATAWMLLYWPLYKMHGTPVGAPETKEEE